MSTSESAPARAAALARRYGHWVPPLTVAAASLILCGTRLGLRLNAGGDDLYHLFNEYALAGAVRAGDSVFGPLGVEFGQPVLRFYQPLLYLHDLGWHLLTGVDLSALHALTIVLCFSLSPLAFCYFLLKLGLPPHAAGIGACLTMISVAGFGNSFEAYFRAGIVSQAMGGLFLPWFFGSFVGLLRGENRAAGTALLFAAAFLSHAILSVFAVFGAALFCLVGGVDAKHWRRVAAFAALAGALVLFWAGPFVAHTAAMRPVPDAVLRGAGKVWFTSLSRDELLRALVSGRLLDDPRVVHGRQVDPLDRLVDRINVLGTVYVRPPVVTVLTGLGVLVALCRFRQAAYRFLLAGFAFSLMLFAGPDDFPWLFRLPFIDRIQAFRCTYWVELFAFGLAGGGVEAVLAAAWRLVERRQGRVRTALAGGCAVLVLAGLGGVVGEMTRCARAHVNVRDVSRFAEMIDVLNALPERGWPFRVDFEFPGKRKFRQAWSVVHGYEAPCSHWKATGPTSSLLLCKYLENPHAKADLFSLAGVRYVVGAAPKVTPVADAREAGGAPLFRRVAGAGERRGGASGGVELFDSGRDGFLQGFPGRPLPVVCTDAQWVWLTSGWTLRYQDRLRGRSTPLPLRVPAGDLAGSGLLERAEAVLYLDDRSLAADEAALARFAQRGGRIVAGARLGGLPVTVPGALKTVWDGLPAGYSRGDGTDPPADSPLRGDLQPDAGRSRQNYRFDVEARAETVAILPVQAASGWQATLDGAPLRVFPAGPDFVGTNLPAGVHRLAFSWSMPAWHRACLAVSLLALAGTLAVTTRRAVARMSDRRRSPASEPAARSFPPNGP